MRIFFTILLLFLVQLSLLGAARIEATVSKNNLTLQETLTLNIAVVSDDKDAEELSAPKFPADFPFQILRQIGPSRSTQSSVSIVNGRVEQNSTVKSSYQYLLKPTKTGSLQIPALSITNGKQQLKTSPITILVADAKQIDPKVAGATATSQAQFRQYLSSESTVMGAPVLLTYELIVPSSLELRTIYPAYNEEKVSLNFKAEGYEDPQWSQQATVINGMRYTVIRKVIHLTPKHPGTLEIPGCTMTYQYVVPRQQSNRNNGRRSLFDDFFEDGPFGMRGQLEENTLVADDITLQVEDFPAEGRPDDFSGLIGPILATASTDLQDVFVGDPITLTLHLTGNNLDQDCTLPDLKTALEKEGKFRVSGDDPITMDEDGTLLYTRTLRVLSPDVTEIPPLQIPYYDIAKKSYNTATTNTIQLTVQENKKVTLGDAHIQGNTPLQIPLPEKTKTMLTETEGVLEINDLDDMARKTWSPFPDDQQRHGLLATLFLAPFLLWSATAIGLHLHRKANKLSPAERAARNAKSVLRNALSQLSEDDAQSGKRLAEALQTFLGQRFGIAGALTANDLNSAMTGKGYSPEQIAKAQALLEQCNAAQYGGSAIDLQTLKTQILECAEEV